MDSKCKNKKVTDIQLRDLAGRLGKEWEKLAINLKFRLDEIERLKCDHQWQEDRIFQLLIDWRQRQPPGAKDSISTLRKALKKSGRNDLASDLAENPDVDVEACREELISFYKTNMGFVQLIPWDDETEDIDAMFVNLELTHERTRRTNNQCGRLLGTNEELFTLETWEGKKVNRVLVAGGPGSGKSTLFAKLAYDWAQQKENTPLSRFALVFLLSFREMTESTNTLTGAIFDQLLPVHSKVSQPELGKYIRSNESRCLILADGFDERSSGFISPHPDNDMENILTHRDYRDCFLVMSTRPHKIYNLGKASKVYTQVSLTGFSGENVSRYIHNFFGDEREAADALILEVSKSKSLQKLSKIPYMLLLLCLIWDEDANLPDTQTKLYQQVLMFMWKRYCFKQSLFHETDSDDVLHEQLDEVLVELGRSVFKTLSLKKEEQILFSKSRFGNDAYEKACAVGLLTKEKLHSKLNGSSNVTFVHKSFQEFCTARFVVHMAKTKPDDFFEFLANIHGRDEVSKFFEILMFSCGLDVTVAERVLEHLVQVFLNLSPDVCYVTHGKYGIWPLFVFGLESGISYDDIHATYQPLFTHSIHISPEWLPELEWMAFDNFMQAAHRSKQQSILQRIAVLDCGDFLTESCISLLCMVLDKMVPRLESLTLRSASEISLDDTDRYNLAEAITKLPLLSDITIDLTDNVSQNNDMFDLTTFLSKISSKQLVNLAILDSKNHKLFFKMEILTEYLSGQEFLSSLSISNLDIDQHRANTLLQTLRKSLNLKQLRISGAQIQDAVKEIDHIAPRLDTLQLSNCELTDELVGDEFAYSVSKLQVVDLSHNDFGDCRRLSVQLPNSQSMVELSLAYARITSDGMVSVSQSLPNMPHLKTLDVSYNRFGLKGLRALFMSLCSLRKMKKLHCGPCQVPGIEPCSPVLSECLSVAGINFPVVRNVHKVILLEIDDAEIINRMFCNRPWEDQSSDLYEISEGRNQQEGSENKSSASEASGTSKSIGEDIIQSHNRDELHIDSVVDNQEHKVEVATFELQERPHYSKGPSFWTFGCRCTLI